MNAAEHLEHLLVSGRTDDAARLTAQIAMADNHSAAIQPAAEAIARAYRNFYASAVHQLYDNLIASVPEASLQPLFAVVQPDIDATVEWNKRLDVIAGERLMNNLIDHVKGKEMEAAEVSAASLITSAATPQLRAARARSIGNVMGGLIHEKDRAQALIKSISRNPSKFGIDPITATDVEEEFARGGAAAARRERPATSASRTQLTEAIVELGRTLPGRNVLQEPTPEDLQKFDRSMRAIVRSGLLSPQLDKLHEATLLIVELSPKEVSAAGALAGVEQRYYATMGRTARLIAVKVLAAMGESPILFTAYMQFAQSQLVTKFGKFAVETLGLFANPQAVPFLIEVVNDKRADARTEAIFALGAVSSQQALTALVQIFSQQVRGKIVDGQPRRDAFTVISSLGRAIRNSSDPNFRSQVIAQLVRMLPKDDLEFSIRAILNFFTGKQDGIEPSLLSWAAQVGVTGLWSMDRPELSRAGRAQVLGFRQPLVDLLKRLAPFTMPVINEAVLKHAKVYNGAYLAIGEFYSQAPDPSQVPVIRQLLLNTALHDDRKRSEYVTDQVYDTATETQEALTKDKVIGSLVYALDKIATPEAQEVMAGVFAQIQGGQLPSAGLETADILMRAHMKAQQSAGSATMAPGMASASYDSIQPTAVTEQDLGYIADLEGSYLLAAKKRSKKVTAMAALAQRKIAPAIPLLIKHLSDNDNMIASSALAALHDFSTPPVAAQTQDQLFRELVQSLETSDNTTKVKVAEAIKKLNPQRAALKERLEKLAMKPGLDKAVTAVVSSLLGGMVPKTATASRTAEPFDEEKLGAAAKFMPKAGATKGSDPSVVTDLDKKRAYMQARREWIQGGKKGPEPQPPA